MNKPIVIKVAGSEAGTELIAFVAKKLKLSRNEAKRIIDSRRVFINNQRVWMARHPLSRADTVEIHGWASATEQKPVKIIWQDAHYLIIDKPSGWLANGPSSIEERLEKELARPVFAVHRLDRDTSGCMLLAWSKADMERMIPVFQRREVRKVYEGIVIGKIPPGLEVIHRRVDGEDAVTMLNVLSRRGAVSRVEFILVTGRTHQIRRHLNAFDLHLAGEKNYGATILDQPELRTITRHMLHAKLLGFPHPDTGKLVQVRAALPPDFRAVAKALGV